MLPAQPPKVISAAIRTELLRLGWKRADFARRLGVDPRHLSNVIGGLNTSGVLRRKIEALLQMAIWSTPSEFTARQDAVANTQNPAASNP